MGLIWIAFLFVFKIHGRTVVPPRFERMLLSEGASMKEAQEWAGHSNYSVTANVYAHVQAKNKSRLTDSISSLLA